MFNLIHAEDFIKKIAIEKINAIIEDECKRYGVIATDIEIKIVENFVFAVSHTSIKTSEGMHRYGLFCFSAIDFQLFYHAANVIDNNKFYTIEKVISATKHFFNKISSELNAI